MEENKQKMKEVIENYIQYKNDIEQIAVKRIKQKMKYLHIREGENNKFLSMYFDRNKNGMIIIIGVFSDDEFQEIEENITFNEFLMTNDEWKDRLNYYNKQYIIKQTKKEIKYRKNQLKTYEEEMKKHKEKEMKIDELKSNIQNMEAVLYQMENMD